MSDNVNPVEDPMKIEPDSTTNEKSKETKLNSVNDEHPISPESEPGLAEEPSDEVERSKNEFRKGLITSFMLYGLAACIYISFLLLARLEAGVSADGVRVFGYIWLFINILVMVWYAKIHKKRFQGLVVGLGLGFFVAMVIGVFITVVCFMGH